VALAGACALLLACGGAPAEAPAGLQRVPLDATAVRGPADAWVTVVEFGDFECPACRSEARPLGAAVDAYPADVRLAFKHFPLERIHPRARAAAIAAECARQGGAFWPMHDALLAGPLDDASLARYAVAAGVDRAAWQACVADPAAAARVDADAALARALGAPGTPHLVVNGEPWRGQELPTAPELRSWFERARAAAQASGIARAEYYDRAVLGR
jgi:protein-disulfide isomerase